MALIHPDSRLDGRSNCLQVALLPPGVQFDLGLIQILDRLRRGPQEQVGEIVEVAVEDRPLDPGALGDVADAEAA